MAHLFNSRRLCVPSLGSQARLGQEHKGDLQKECCTILLSESQFKTLKYRPDFPDRFASHDHGLDFCRGFFHWHNEEHRHWGIALLTPAIVHTGQATTILEARASVLAAAYACHPERFVQGVPSPLTLAAEVWINQPENRPTVRTLELPRDTKFVSQLSQSH